MAKDTPQYRYYLRNREARNAEARERMRVLRSTPEGIAAHRAQQKRSNDKLKAEVFEHYGKACSCCGETGAAFLTIDHVNGDGTQHRKTMRGPSYLYRWLRQNGFPAGFQVLCFNCNCGRALNSGVCPHTGVVSPGRSTRNQPSTST